MIHTIFKCDECGKESPHYVAALKGNWSSSKGGIMLPRSEYHFCTRQCLLRWVTNATLNNEYTGERT